MFQTQAEPDEPSGSEINARPEVGGDDHRRCGRYSAEGVADRGEFGAQSGWRLLCHWGTKYTSDMAVPGMLFGKVLRPTAYGGKLTAFDDQRLSPFPA